MTESLRNAGAKGARWTAASALTTTVLGLATVFVTARYLGPSEFGLMAIINIVVGFGGIFVQSGLSEAIIHYRDTTKQQLATLFWVNIFAGCLFTAVLYLVAPAISSTFEAPELTSPLRLVSVIFLVSSLGLQSRTLLQRDLLFRRLASAELASTICGTIVTIVLAIVLQTIWALVIGAIVTTAIRSATLIALSLPQHGLPSLQFRLPQVLPHLRFGLMRIGSASTNFVGSRADQLIVGAMLGTNALGYYNLAHQLAIQPTRQINPIVSRIAFPIFAQVQSDTNRMRSGYFLLSRILVSVNAPLLLGAAACAPVAFPVIFGEKWGPAAPVFQLLCVYSLFRSIANSASSVLLARGRASATFYWNIAILPLLPIVVYMVSQSGDLLLVAGALATMQAVLTALHYMVLVQRELAASLLLYLRTSILPPALIAFVMATSVFLFGMSSIKPSIFLLIGQITAGMLLYFFLYYLFQRAYLDEIRSLVLAR